MWLCMSVGLVGRNAENGWIFSLEHKSCDFGVENSIREVKECRFSVLECWGSEKYKKT